MDVAKRCRVPADQALGVCADPFYNLTCWWNIVDQCAALAGNYASDVKIATFPGRRVFATNVFHIGFQ